ncbi:MAG: type II secretion system protein [Bacilli bacterium]|nr:type II secretion system protein [Bacilli bacterium]
MRNNSGFTLVELLAAIAILGILAGVGTMSVSRIIYNSRIKYYKALKSNIEEAARSYFNDHRILLPAEKEDSNEVTAQQLIDAKYFSRLQDHRKNDCDKNESKVIVTRKSLEEYTYDVILVCPSVSSEYYE